RDFEGPPVSLRAVSRLLNSLFKVLCNFPSRYLFAIGLAVVFSLEESTSRLGAALPSNPTLRRRRHRRGVRGHGPGTRHGKSPCQGTYLEPCGGPARTPYATFPRVRLSTQGFGAGLFPFRSPLLGESLLFSFPPLTDMLKFGGFSRLI
ncbi:hypothetical protein TNCT_6561, partial [Trichonephila clavata]